MLPRIIREPLLHFMCLGVLLFIVYDFRNNTPSTTSSHEITITKDRIERLSAAFAAVWNRPPSQEERDAIIDNYIYEEILVREALALGMDKSDSVIRQRLRLKMEFLASGAAQAIQPTEEEIEAYYQEHIETFSHPRRLSFEQVYLGSTPADGFADTTMSALNSGVSPRSVGKRSLLSPMVELSQVSQIDSTFGTGFFETLWALKVSGWQGPVDSSYGQHLVRILEHADISPRKLENIRPIIITTLKSEIAGELAELQKAALLSRYTVVRPEAE